MALPVDGKRDGKIPSDRFVALGEKLGVRPRAGRAVIERVAASADTWLDGSPTCRSTQARGTNSLGSSGTGSSCYGWGEITVRSAMSSAGPAGLHTISDEEVRRMWDIADDDRGHHRVHLCHDLPCPRCGHAVHTFLPCSDTCGCQLCTMPGEAAA